MVSFVGSKIAHNDCDYQPTIFGDRNRLDLFGAIRLATPLIVELEIPPKTSPIKFDGELLALLDGRHHLGFRCAPLGESLLCVWMKANVHAWRGAD
jgi:hypothetical protein